MRLLTDDSERISLGAEGAAWLETDWQSTAIKNIAAEGLAKLQNRVARIRLDIVDIEHYREDTSYPEKGYFGAQLKDLRPVMDDPKIVVTHALTPNVHNRTLFFDRGGWTEVMVFDTAVDRGSWAVAEGLFQAAVWLSGMVYGELLVEMYGFMPYYEWRYNPNYRFDPRYGRSRLENYYWCLLPCWDEREEAVMRRWWQRQAGIEDPGYLDLQPRARQPRRRWGEWSWEKW